MIDSSVAQGSRVYRLVLWGIVAWGLGAVPAAHGQTAGGKFAALPAPPKTPAPKSRFSHDSDLKPITLRFRYTRVPILGIISLRPDAAAPDELVIHHDQAGGFAPPTLSDVKLQFTYQGQARTFPVAPGPIDAVRGDYKIPLDDFRKALIAWITNRNGPGLDPNHPPDGIFAIGDPKFLVVYDVPNGKPQTEVVGPGDAAVKVLFEEQN